MIQLTFKKGFCFDIHALIGDFLLWALLKHSSRPGKIHKDIKWSKRLPYIRFLDSLPVQIPNQPIVAEQQMCRGQNECCWECALSQSVGKYSIQIVFFYWKTFIFFSPRPPTTPLSPASQPYPRLPPPPPRPPHSL